MVYPQNADLAGVRIALLRGINVGGKSIVAMSDLRAAFVEAGFSDASTYIASGNILFRSDQEALDLQASIGRLVAERFGIDTPVAVITASELAEALAQAPEWWGRTPGDRHNAIFAISPATAQSVTAEVGDIKPEYEQLAWHGQLIFWSAPMKTFSRTRWGTVSKLPIYQQITIRGRNTALKLLELAEQKAMGTG